MKLNYIHLIFSIFISISHLNSQKTETIILIENDQIKLDVMHEADADISKKDWIKIRLRNKSRKNLYFKTINYSINTFENNSSGEGEIKSGALGRSKMYNLIDSYHNLKTPKKEHKIYTLDAKKELIMWRYPSNTASSILDNLIKGEEEVCALLEMNLEYGTSTDFLDTYSAEEALCFNWKHSSLIDPIKIAQHLEEKINYVTQRNINSAIINTMVLNEDVIKKVSIDTIIYGIHRRGYTDNKTERIGLLKSLDVLGGFNNENIISHYKTCMEDSKCQWIDDLKYYWHPELFDILIANNIFINEKVKILNSHSDTWRKNSDQKEKFLNNVLSKIDFDFNYIPDQNGFQKWYQNIKLISSTRHPKVIKYLMSLLDNETFLKIEDWSSQRNKRVITNNDKPKVIQFRICDVAYVGLLRALNKIKLNSSFEGFRFKQSLFIDKQWRGVFESSTNPFRLKNPYTTLPINLNMAEKYYYLYEGNKLAIRKSLRRNGY